MKRIAPLCALALVLAACATAPPTPPSFFVEDLPPGVTTEMTLEQRIAAEDGWSALRAGRGDAAERQFLRLGADQPVGLLGLGYVAFLRNDLQTAREQFDAALRLRPDLVPAHEGLAQLAERAGDDDRLFTELREILKAEPDHAWARPRFDSLRERKSKELRDKADAALSSGDFESAKKIFLTILFFNPESAETHLELARVYSEERNLASAIVHLKAAADLRPQDAKIWRLYAETLGEAEQYGRSLEAFETVASLDPNDKSVAERIGQLKEKLGIVEVPSRFSAIGSSPAVTREDVAALIAVKFRRELEGGASKPPVIIDLGTTWARTMIIRVATLELMEVYDNHTFQPDKAVTRAEMAEILWRMTSFLRDKGARLIPQIAPERLQIADVPPEHPYHDAIVAAVGFQLMELSPQHTFDPTASVTGDEAVRIFDTLLALVR